jgi:ribosomal protein S18 acetylase RimI-like enzyme
MATETEINEACSLLETDVLRHLVALKMLHLHGRESELTVRRSGADWGVITRLPVAAAPWDRKNYPTASESVIVDGSRPEPAIEMLALAPRAVIVVKTGEPAVGRALAERGAERRLSLLSFTRGPDTRLPAAAAEVERSDVLDGESARLFGENGYLPAELEGHFARGARRFTVREGGRIASLCFVYQNYGRVWEIAGVYTPPECRGRGLAKKTVGAALAYLAESGLTPRYQVVESNWASIAVARSLGLEHFLTQGHFLWDRRR